MGRDRLGKDLRAAVNMVADAPTPPTEGHLERSAEEQSIVEQIRYTEQNLQELHKRLRLEEQISDIKRQADRLRLTL